jgi:hypothetical protein
VTRSGDIGRQDSHQASMGLAFWSRSSPCEQTGIVGVSI